jgi:hypothetical protein
MTDQELNARARERAIRERLHTFKIAGQPVYLVRSRQTEPGSMHPVRVSGGQVTRCGCGRLGSQPELHTRCCRRPTTQARIEDTDHIPRERRA